MRTVADELATGLIAAGVTRGFGVPGGEIVHLLDALRRNKIPFILTRHETAAAFMASATARLTGAVGACFSTLGPGAANTVSGVAHAYLDREPLLLVTGQVPATLRERHTHQLLDLQAILGSITKLSREVGPQDPAALVKQAAAMAVGGRPGPVHLQFSSDTAAAPAQGGGAADREARSRAPEAEVPPKAIGVAVDILSKSMRPVIVAGLGLEPEGPYADLEAFAEACSAPVIVTPKAKGAISDHHPLSAGTIGLTPRDPAYRILEQADCIVAIGFDPVELIRPWDHPAPLIWVSGWKNLDPTLPAVSELVGPIGLTLQSLRDTTPATAADWGADRIAQHRGGLVRHSIPEPRSGTLRPIEVLTELRQALPGDVTVTTDVGSHKILACLEWKSTAPNRFLVSNGLSSMGYGLPAAIAASQALPDSQVVCLTGDAGLAMVLGELGTLAELGTSVLVVVFKDDALDLIRSHQRRAGYPTWGTELRGPNFVHVAEAHGIEGTRVQNLSDCSRAIGEAISAQRPFLIEALIDPSSYPTAVP